MLRTRPGPSFNRSRSGCVGRWYGRIINSPRGEGGFSYDHFSPDGLHQTAAELDSETKIS